LKSIVHGEIKKAGAKTKSERMTIRQAMAHKEWNSETTEVQEFVMAELEKMKEGTANNQLTNLDKAYGPEDYNKSVRLRSCLCLSLNFM